MIEKKRNKQRQKKGEKERKIKRMGEMEGERESEIDRQTDRKRVRWQKRERETHEGRGRVRDILKKRGSERKREVNKMKMMKKIRSQQFKS